MPSSDDSPTRDSFASATNRWERARRLRPADWADVALAAVSLVVAAAALERRGLAPVQEKLASLSPWRPSPLAPHEAVDEARRLAWIVGVASRRVFRRANCLQRSLTLWWLLRRRGLKGELRIGVRRKRMADPAEEGAVEFHAWVEHAGVVLNDVRDVRDRFATFDRVIIPANVDWS